MYVLNALTMLCVPPPPPQGMYKKMKTNFQIANLAVSNWNSGSFDVCSQYGMAIMRQPIPDQTRPMEVQNGLFFTRTIRGMANRKSI